MKFQRVYAEAHEKKRAKEAIKRQHEAEVEKARKKEEKQAEKIRRRKAWEDEQLRKRMEEEIFGQAESGDDNHANVTAETVQEITKTGDNGKQSNMQFYLLILALFISITVYMLN